MTSEESAKWAETISKSFPSPLVEMARNFVAFARVTFLPSAVENKPSAGIGDIEMTGLLFSQI